MLLVPNRFPIFRVHARRPTRSSAQNKLSVGLAETAVRTAEPLKAASDKPLIHFVLVDHHQSDAQWAPCTCREGKQTEEVTVREGLPFDCFALSSNMTRRTAEYLNGGGAMPQTAAEPKIEPWLDFNLIAVGHW